VPETQPIRAVAARKVVETDALKVRFHRVDLNRVGSPEGQPLARELEGTDALVDEYERNGARVGEGGGDRPWTRSRIDDPAWGKGGAPPHLFKRGGHREGVLGLGAGYRPIICEIRAQHSIILKI
jgi:hypothetical protein